MLSGLRRGWVACRGDLTGFFHLVGGILGTRVCESPVLPFKIPWCSKRKLSKQCGKAPGISAMRSHWALETNLGFSSCWFKMSKLPFPRSQYANEPEISLYSDKDDKCSISSFPAPAASFWLHTPTPCLSSEVLLTSEVPLSPRLLPLYSPSGELFL